MRGHKPCQKKCEHLPQWTANQGYDLKTRKYCKTCKRRLVTIQRNCPCCSTTLRFTKRGGKGDIWKKMEE